MAAGNILARKSVIVARRSVIVARKRVIDFRVETESSFLSSFSPPGLELVTSRTRLFVLFSGVEKFRGKKSLLLSLFCPRVSLLVAKFPTSGPSEKREKRRGFVVSR